MTRERVSVVGSTPKPFGLAAAHAFHRCAASHRSAEIHGLLGLHGLFGQVLLSRNIDIAP